MKKAQELLQLLHRSFIPPSGKYHSLELEKGPDGKLSVLVWTSPYEREGFVFSEEDFKKEPAALCTEIVGEVIKRRQASGKS